MRADEFIVSLKPKTALIVSGVPGSGKSHLLKAIADEVDLGRVAFDDFRMKGERYEYHPGDSQWIQPRALKAFERAMIDHGVAAVEATFTSADKIEPFVRRARQMGFKPIVVTVKMDPAKAHKRNTHGVGESAVKAMAKALEARRLPRVWERVVIDGAE